MYYYRNHTANSSRSEVWRVEALASILRVQSYVAYLLCNTSSNNGSGVSWKGQGTVNANFIQKPATNGKLLFVSNYTANTEEGIYTCVDSLSNDTLSINITNGEPQSVVQVYFSDWVKQLDWLFCIQSDFKILNVIQSINVNLSNSYYINRDGLT